MKDFFGDDIAPRRKNRKGVEKAIYFAKISCAEFEQYMVDGNIVSNNLLVLLEKSFKKNNKFYQETNGVEIFVFPFKEQKYAISLIEKNDRYYFGRISTEKEHNEILEEYKVEGENVKKIIKLVNVIKKKGLNNILVAVVRYFGGIKLGAGGLTRAYTKAPPIR